MPTVYFSASFFCCCNRHGYWLENVFSKVWFRGRCCPSTDRTDWSFLTANCKDNSMAFKSTGQHQQRSLPSVGSGKYTEWGQWSECPVREHCELIPISKALPYTQSTSNFRFYRHCYVLIRGKTCSAFHARAKLVRKFSILTENPVSVELNTSKQISRC